MAVTPDLAGLSLGGAIQAGQQAGYERFAVLAYRQTWMVSPTYLFREAAPAVGYVAQTSTPGTSGSILPTTPPDGSFYTASAQPGVPDQRPAPGTPVEPNAILRFVYQTADFGQAAADSMRSGVDPATSVTAWWEWQCRIDDLPAGLAEQMALYNGPPRAPVDITDHEWPEVAQDPLVGFTGVTVAEPADLIDDIPQFERKSYEINAVLRVIANELARIETAQQGLIQNWFPHTADVLLSRHEQRLGLPVDSTLTPEDRRARVLNRLHSLTGEGRGRDWTHIMDDATGNDWEHVEHDPDDPDSPGAHNLRVDLRTHGTKENWQQLRDNTPAHIDINGVTCWRVGIAYLDYTIF